MKRSQMASLWKFVMSQPGQRSAPGVSILWLLFPTEIISTSALTATFVKASVPFDLTGSWRCGEWGSPASRNQCHDTYLSPADDPYRYCYHHCARGGDYRGHVYPASADFSSPRSGPRAL